MIEPNDKVREYWSTMQYYHRHNIKRSTIIPNEMRSYWRERLF